MTDAETDLSFLTTAPAVEQNPAPVNPVVEQVAPPERGAVEQQRPVEASPAPVPTVVPATPSKPVLSLPNGYIVVVSSVGCLPDGTCPFGQRPANFYWSQTRTTVVFPNQPAWTLQHEAAHAHQHLTILRELGVEPGMPYDLHEWLATSEARAWSAMVSTPWPATGQWAVEPGAHNAVEDFAISAGLFFTDPQQLRRISPDRYDAIVGVLSP